MRGLLVDVGAPEVVDGGESGGGRADEHVFKRIDVVGKLEMLLYGSPEDRADEVVGHGIRVGVAENTGLMDLLGVVGSDPVVGPSLDSNEPHVLGKSARALRASRRLVEASERFSQGGHHRWSLRLRERVGVSG